MRIYLLGNEQKKLEYQVVHNHDENHDPILKHNDIHQ